MGDLSNPGIESGSLELQADSSPSESPGKPATNYPHQQIQEFTIK